MEKERRWEAARWDAGVFIQAISSVMLSHLDLFCFSLLARQLTSHIENHYKLFFSKGGLEGACLLSASYNF